MMKPPFKASDSAIYSVQEFLIHFEVWAKLAQQWLMCVPFGNTS